MNSYFQLFLLMQISAILCSTFLNQEELELSQETGAKMIESYNDAVAIYCKNVYPRVRMDPNTSPSQAFTFGGAAELEWCVTRARFLLPKAKSVFYSPQYPTGECIAYFEEYSVEKFDYVGKEGSTLCEFEKALFDKGDCENEHPQTRVVIPPYFPDSLRPGFELPLEPGRTLQNCIYQAEAALPKVKSVFHSPEGECIGYYKSYDEQGFTNGGSEGSTLCEVPQHAMDFVWDARKRPTFEGCIGDPFFNRWRDLFLGGHTVELPNKAATMNACVQMGLAYGEETIQAVQWKTKGTCIGYYGMPDYTRDTSYKGPGIASLTKGGNGAVSFFCYVQGQPPGPEENPWDSDFVEPTVHPLKKFSYKVV